MKQRKLLKIKEGDEKLFDLDDENRLISSSMKVEDNDTEVSLRPKFIRLFRTRESKRTIRNIYRSGKVQK